MHAIAGDKRTKEVVEEQFETAFLWSGDRQINHSKRESRNRRTVANDCGAVGAVGKVSAFWLADRLPPRSLQCSDRLWRTADASALHRRGNANAQSSRDSRRARRKRLGISSLLALFGESGLFIKISKVEI